MPMRTLEVGDAALGEQPDLASPTDEPAHVRIAAWLLARAHRGALWDGDKLPPEEVLAGALGVSRMTLRQALGSLEQQGWIERRRGRTGGNFVQTPRIDVDLTGMSGFTEQMRRANVRAGARVVRSSVVAPSAEVAKELQLRRRDRVVELVRVRSAHREPLALEESYLPADLFPGLAGRRLTGSLYAAMRLHYGLAPHHAQEWLEPEIVSHEHAQLLGIEDGAAVMLVTRRAVTETGLPVEFARDRYRADRSRISLHTQVDRSGPAGAGVMKA